MEHLRLADSVIERVDVTFVKVEAASVELLEVCLPSWTQPLSVKIRGLRLDVRQRNMPQVN